MIRVAVCTLLLAVPACQARIGGEDFLYAETQFRQLIEDRAAMAEVLTEADPLRTWTIVRFAGAATGFRIAWDGRPPPQGIEAQHQLQPTPTIRVHPVHQTGPLRGTPKNGRDLWADVIFELHNIAQAEGFQAAWQRVQAGRLGYGGWLEAVTRLEHRSLLYTRAFYRTRWRVWMRQRGMPHLSIRWRQLQAVPTDYVEWIIRYRDAEDYPYSDYGSAYRAATAGLRAAGKDWSTNPFRYHLIETALSAPK